MCAGPTLADFRHHQVAAISVGRLSYRNMIIAGYQAYGVQCPFQFGLTGPMNFLGVCVLALRGDDGGTGLVEGAFDRGSRIISVISLRLGGLGVCPGPTSVGGHSTGL